MIATLVDFAATICRRLLLITTISPVYFETRHYFGAPYARFTPLFAARVIYVIAFITLYAMVFYIDGCYARFTRIAALRDAREDVACYRRDDVYARTP